MTKGELRVNIDKKGFMDSYIFLRRSTDSVYENYFITIHMMTDYERKEDGSIIVSVQKFFPESYHYEGKYEKFSLLFSPEDNP